MKEVLYWISIFGLNDMDSHNSEVTKPAVAGLMLEHIQYHCVARFNHDNSLIPQNGVCH